MKTVKQLLEMLNKPIKGKRPWHPVNDSDHPNNYYDTGTNDGRGATRFEVKNGDDYRDELKSHGWKERHDPIDAESVFVHKDHPGHEVHVEHSGYGIGDFRASCAHIFPKKKIKESI